MQTPMNFRQFQDTSFEVKKSKLTFLVKERKTQYPKNAIHV